MMAVMVQKDLGSRVRGNAGWCLAGHVVSSTFLSLFSCLFLAAIDFSTAFGWHGTIPEMNRVSTALYLGV